MKFIASLIGSAALIAFASGTDRFGGIGVTIQADQGGVRIVQVLDDSPAEAAGLHNGDLVTAVDGHALTGDVDAAKASLRGLAGTDVELSIKRDGETTALSFTLERKSFVLKSFAVQDLANFYGDAPNHAYTPAELRNYAEQSPEQGHSLADLIVNGKTVGSSTVTPASNGDIQSVFVGNAQSSGLKALVNPALGLQSADRMGASFVTTQEGSATVTLRTADGAVLLATTTGRIGAGSHTVSWNGSGIPAGSYLVEVRQGTLNASQSIHIN